MPPRKSTETLFMHAASCVAFSIRDYIELHSEDDCDTCSEYVIPEVICPSLKKARLELEVSEEILQTLLDISVPEYKNARQFYLTNRYFTFFLTENCRLKTRYTLRRNQDLILTRKFGKFMNVVHISSSFIFTTKRNFRWANLFSNISKVQMIWFEDVEIMDEIFAALGKYCHNICYLDKITFGSDVTIESLKKFCFSDYPNNKVQNPCCTTLKVMNIDWENLEDDHLEMMLDEGCLFLLRNLRNLTYAGTFPAEKLFDHMSETRKIFCLSPSQLQIIQDIFSADKKTILNVHCLFPELQILSLVYPDMDSIHNIAIFQQLKVLSVVLFEDTNLDMFLKQKWYNLEDLSLETYANLDLSVLAYSCPNLESFYSTFSKSQNTISNCRSGFRNMKSLCLTCKGHFVHYDIIPYVANSIEYLYIYASTSPLRSEDIYKILIEIPLPHLKGCVLEPPLKLPKESLKKLICHCESLESLGMIPEEHFALELELDNENYLFSFEYDDDNEEGLDFDILLGGADVANQQNDVVQAVANGIIQIFNEFPALFQALEQHIGQAVPQEGNEDEDDNIEDSIQDNENNTADSDNDEDEEENILTDEFLERLLDDYDNAIPNEDVDDDTTDDVGTLTEDQEESDLTAQNDQVVTPTDFEDFDYFGDDFNNSSGYFTDYSDDEDL